MFPIQIVELNLHKVPFIDIVFREQIVKDLDVAMIRETQILYSSLFTFLKKEIQKTIVYISSLIILHAIAYANSVEQQIVNIIYLQLLERIAIHGNGRLSIPCRRGKIRQFGRNEIFVSWMTA